MVLPADGPTTVARGGAALTARRAAARRMTLPADTPTTVAHGGAPSMTRCEVSESDTDGLCKPAQPETQMSCVSHYACFASPFA